MFDHNEHHAFHHPHHSKNTKNADISRLLDPAYSSTAASSSQTRVYIDHHGDLHDPDYRHFPTTSPKRQQRSNRRASSGASTNPFSSRPQWEFGVDDDEFDEYYHDGEEDYSQPSTSSSTRRSRTPTYPVFTYASYSSSNTPPSYNSSPLSTAFHESPESTSSPFSDSKCSAKLAVPLKAFRRPSKSRKDRRSSLDSISDLDAEEHVHPSETHDEEEVESAYNSYIPSPRGGRTSRARRSFEAYEDEALGFVAEREREIKSEEGAVKDEQKEKDTDSKSDSGVPSCTQVMRRQWQAMSLSVSFGVFRWRRRMRRVLSR